MTTPAPPIALIAAMTENRVIGAEGAMPWHLPDDLKRFKRLTLGHPILMGRRTFASIGKPLPGRRNLILTRDPAFTHEGVEIVHSFDDALRLVEPTDALYVIGGEQVYRLALPRATQLYLTLIHVQLPGDVHFPDFDPEPWALVAEEHHPADARHAYAMTFRDYQRRANGDKVDGSA